MEEPPKAGAPRPRDPLLFLALALALGALGSTLADMRHAGGLDFYQFWVVAQVAGRPDVADIYDYDTRARLGAEYIRRAEADEESERRRVIAPHWPVLEPTATPLFYAAFRPLALCRFEPALLAFALVGLAAASAGLLLLARLLGLRAALGLLVLAFVGYAFQPLKSDVRVGNVNQLQLGLVALYAWLSSRPERSRLQVAAGGLLGLLVLFKPNLAPLVPLLGACWFWRRRRAKLARQGAGLAAGLAVAAAATLLVFGSIGVWPRWLDYLNGLPPAKIPLSYGNVGLGRILFEAVGEDLSPLLAPLALAAALFCLWRSRLRGPAEAGAVPAAVEDVSALAAGILVYLLSAPIVWTHYLLLVLPAVLLLLRPGPGRERPALAVAALLAVAIDPWADAFGVADLQHQALVVTLGLLVLFVLVCREMAGWPALSPPGAEARMPAGGAP